MKGSIMRRMIFVFLFFGIVLPSFAQEQESDRFVKIFNRLVDEMNNQDYDGIVREYNKDMKSLFLFLKQLIFSKTIMIRSAKLSK